MSSAVQPTTDRKQKLKKSAFAESGSWLFPNWMTAPRKLLSIVVIRRLHSQPTP